MNDFFPLPCYFFRRWTPSSGGAAYLKAQGDKRDRECTCAVVILVPQSTRAAFAKGEFTKRIPFFPVFFFLLLVYLQLHYHQTHPDPRLFQATAGEEVKLISAGVEH